MLKSYTVDSQMYMVHDDRWLVCIIENDTHANMISKNTQSPQKKLHKHPFRSDMLQNGKVRN